MGQIKLVNPLVGNLQYTYPHQRTTVICILLCTKKYPTLQSTHRGLWKV